MGNKAQIGREYLAALSGAILAELGGDQEGLLVGVWPSFVVHRRTQQFPIET